MLLTFFVVGYLFLSLEGTLTWRYFAALLPIAAVLTGIWIGGLQNRVASSILILLCVTTTVFNFAIITRGLQPWNRSAATLLGAATASCGFDFAQFCPSPPRKNEWLVVDDILRAILDDSDCTPDHCDVLIATQSNPLGQSKFLLRAQLNFPGEPLSAQRLGYVNGGEPFNLPALFNSQYIVYEDVSQPKGEALSAAAIRLLQSPPPVFAGAFEEVAGFKLPNRNNVKVLKRIKPATLQEAVATITAIELGEKYLTRQYEVLAPLYAQAGQFENALKVYRKALEYKPSDASLYFGLAGVYESLGQSDDAASAYRQVIVMAPGSDLARRSQDWLDAH